jgi:hypothetical protein
VNSPPPKPEVILTNFFAEPTVLLVPITSRDEASYENLLIKAKMPTQHIRRIRTMALEAFKISSGLAPPVLSNLVRYTNLLQIPQVKSSRYGKSSFRYAAPVLWNSLPDNNRNCSYFNEFKNMISFWNGKSCTCIACQNA